MVLSSFTHRIVLDLFVSPVSLPTYMKSIVGEHPQEIDRNNFPAERILECARIDYKKPDLMLFVDGVVLI